MGNKLNTKRSQEWIKQGAPEQALDFLGQAVDKLHQVAVEKQIVFKEKDDDMAGKNKPEKQAEEEVPTTDSAQTSEEQVEEQTPQPEIADSDVTADGVKPTQTDGAGRGQSTTDSPSEPAPASASVADVLQKGIAEAIVVALKEYNTTVVAPLQAQLAELSAKLKTAPQEATTKSYAVAENVFFGASDFMPSAAVAAMMKKEFGGDVAQKSDDVVVEDVEKVETVVKEKPVTTKNFDPNNVLAGF